MTSDPRNPAKDFTALNKDLLLNIISFLPFKEAVRTSVLSKQWEDICYSSTNVEFRETFFVKPGISVGEKVRRRRDFVEFMKKWIRKHTKLDVETFRFSLSKPDKYYDEVVDECLQFAARRKVKNLDLDFSDPVWHVGGRYRKAERKVLLDEFENEFESLKLFSCNFAFTTSPPPRSYNVLKSLYLGWIKLKPPSLKSLLGACPFLESLSLLKCWSPDFIWISEVPRMKSLVIDRCLVDYQNPILVQATNLKFLKYTGRFLLFDLENLRTLEEMVLDFGIETQYQVTVGERLFKLLRKLSSIRVLTICSYTLKAIQSANNPFILEAGLEGVQKLILKASLEEIEFYGISYFLNSCRSLDVLTIHRIHLTRPYNVQPPRGMGEHPFLILDKERAAVFECLKSLRVVEVFGYQGNSCEQRVLTYLIRHGLNLKSMFLHLSDTRGCIWETRETFLSRAKKLRQLPKASPNLHISII